MIYWSDFNDMEWSVYHFSRTLHIWHKNSQKRNFLPDRRGIWVDHVTTRPKCIRSPVISQITKWSQKPGDEKFVYVIYVYIWFRYMSWHHPIISLSHDCAYKVHIYRLSNCFCIYVNNCSINLHRFSGYMFRYVWAIDYTLVQHYLILVRYI